MNSFLGMALFGVYRTMPKKGKKKGSEMEK